MARVIITLLALLFVGRPVARAADAEGFPPVVHQWLATQTNVQTWHADVTQQRFLKALKQPLLSTGEVWFSYPNRFRWQLGNPPQTIALRAEDEMTLLYPKLKRAERYAFKSTGNNQWRDILKLLEAGFPKSTAELEQQFRLKELTVTNDLHELRLEPRSAAARKMMPGVAIIFSTNTWLLTGTELEFADGSRMRNTFFNARTNAPISIEIFALKPGPDYKVVDALKGAK
ncbi:MAG TPA: outer-membrane lipoprotein carrier protein LolA [Methylomirabilota bacterium]|nr:outer-membrane lipoprotein carrier protein LolA [Methylomirabilota bacterium]